MKLNFGCGTNILDGWENYDLHPLQGAKFIDLNIVPYPFDTSSADYIFVEHCLEHLDLDKFYGFLLESRRILKPGGVLRIAVPSVSKILKKTNFSYSMFLKQNGWSDGGIEGDVRNILLNHGHKLFFSVETLSAILESLGFATKECNMFESEYEQLKNVEGHWKALGKDFADLETIIVEAKKP